MKTDKSSSKSIKKNKNSPNLPKLKLCTIRVGENLYKRISKHVDTLKKCFNNSYSRNRWISDAVHAKLEKEIQSNSITVDKHLGARIDVRILNKINEQVKLMKKFNSSYSKQKWLVEAISEKLEEDEQSTKNRLNELITASKKETRKSGKGADIF